jgi:hypothetical protein
LKIYHLANLVFIPDGRIENFPELGDGAAYFKVTLILLDTNGKMLE